MVQAAFSHEMREILRNMMGHRFVAYEYGDDTVQNSAFGNVRLYTDDISVELCCEEKTLPFFDQAEDITSLSCQRVDHDVPFVPAIVTSTKRIPVDEQIVSIEIIHDCISVNHGEYQIGFDVAVVFRCEKQILMFARGIWFSEVITILPDDDYEKVFPMQKIIESWSNEGEYDVQVERTRNVLSA